MWSRKHVVEHIDAQHMEYMQENELKVDDLVERYLTSEGQVAAIKNDS